MADDEQRGTCGAETGFATGWPAGRELEIELPEERAEPTLDGPWLDDPSYEVGAFLLGLSKAR